MVPQEKREAFRAILSGKDVIKPGSVYDPISARIAEDVGFELGLFGGSAASLTILGDPDLLLITLSEPRVCPCTSRPSSSHSSSTLNSRADRGIPRRVKKRSSRLR